MKGGFFRRFAKDCMKKNKRMYIPYMMTCILMVTLFFIIQSLMDSPGLNQTFGASGITYILQLGSNLMIVFSAVFLFYTNSFLTKQRKHEFGIYNVLGLEKRHIARIIFNETLITAFITLIIGILAGILFYKLAYALLYRLLGTEIPLGFEFSAQALIRTVILFAVIHLILFLNAFRQIRFSNVISLLKGSDAGEKEPRSKWLLGIAGAVSLIAGYVISIRMTNPLAAFSLFFLAVLLVVAGTYLLFISGSIIWLKLMRKNRKYYYGRTSHFINISSMLYRMKQNAASLASICILSTMVVIAISTTLCLYSGCNEILYQRYPRDINVSASLTPQENENPEQYFIQIQQLAENTADTQGISRSNELSVTSLSVGAMQNADSFITNADNISINMNNICAITFLDTDNYNRLTGQKVTLSKGDVLIYCSEDTYPYDTMNIFDLSFNVTDTLNGFKNMNTLPTNSGLLAYCVIVDSPDTLMTLYQSQADLYGEKASSIDFYCGFNIPDLSKDRQQQLTDTFNSHLKNIQTTYANDNQISITKAQNNLDAYMQPRDLKRNNFVSLYGGMFFVGIFLSVIFLIATVLIIYYKQISEGLQDTRRYEIMQHVGLSRNEIRNCIRSQILMVFFLPLIMAGIHSCFAFPIVSRMLNVLAMSNTHSFLFCLAGTFVGFAVFYIIIYLVTARSYYRIVSH